MILARVRGNVVSTNKAEKLQGLKLLIVIPIDIETFEEKGAPLVVIDTVGAGEGEVVMCVSGSSSRQTAITEGKPSDFTIIAIIDSVELRGKLVFRKYGSAEMTVKNDVPVAPKKSDAEPKKRVPKPKAAKIDKIQKPIQEK